MATAIGIFALGKVCNTSASDAGTRMAAPTASTVPIKRGSSAGRNDSSFINSRAASMSSPPNDSTKLLRSGFQALSQIAA